MKFNSLFLLSFISLTLLVACSQRAPTAGDKMITASEKTKELGNSWNQGGKLIVTGEALQAKGRNSIAKGNDQISEGKSLIADGEDTSSSGSSMIHDGQTQVFNGQRLQKESEAGFQQAYLDNESPNS